MKDSKNPNICYEFEKKGYCLKSDCKFEHKEIASPSSEIICKQFEARGYCDRGDSCRFTHKRNEHQKICDQFFATGTCDRGLYCKFKHIKKCKFFKFNDCYLGDKCEYSHDMSRDNTPAKADDGYPNKGENNKKFIKKRKYEDYQGGYEHSDAKVKKYNNISVEYNAATTNNQNNKSSFHEESKILFDTLSSNKNNVISEADVNYNDKINESTMQFLSYIKKKVDYENGNNLDNLNKLNVKFLNLQQENENLKNLILLNHAEMLKKLNNEKNLLTTDLGIDTNDSQFSSFEEKLSAIEKIKLPFTQLVDKVFQLESKC